jgi:hypothetical protein
MMISSIGDEEDSDKIVSAPFPGAVVGGAPAGTGWLDEEMVEIINPLFASREYTILAIVKAGPSMLNVWVPIWKAEAEFAVIVAPAIVITDRGSLLAGSFGDWSPGGSPLCTVAVRVCVGWLFTGGLCSGTYWAVGLGIGGSVLVAIVGVGVAPAAAASVAVGAFCVTMPLFGPLLLLLL